MLVSLALSLAFSSQIQWTDGLIGRHFVSSGEDARSHTIHRFSQLVAIMDHDLKNGKEDDYQPTDSVVDQIEKMPCKLAVIDSVDGSLEEVLEWGKPDSGLDFIVNIKGDSLTVIDFFLYRPTEFASGNSGISFVWSHPGKLCSRWQYRAELQDGRFQIVDRGLIIPPVTKCKDPGPRLQIQRRIDAEMQRDSDLRCDVADFFPRVGGCWSLDVPQEPKSTADPDDPDDY